MAKNRKAVKVAVDTCLLLDMFLDEEQTYAERTARVFDDPEFEVYLPTLVGVEAVSTPTMRGGQQVAPISNEHIDKAKEFFESADVFWVELDEWAMRRAQQLGPERVIKPQDVAILACAIEAGCEYLFTKDKGLINASKGLEGIKVCPPPDLGGTQTALNFT